MCLTICPVFYCKSIHDGVMQNAKEFDSLGRVIKTFIAPFIVENEDRLIVGIKSSYKPGNRIKIYFGPVDEYNHHVLDTLMVVGTQQGEFYRELKTDSIPRIIDNNITGHIIEVDMPDGLLVGITKFEYSLLKYELVDKRK